jgi:acyl carrier protein
MTNPRLAETSDVTALKRQLKEMVLRACHVQEVSVDEIPDDDALINGPGPLLLDSLDALEIAVALHRDFGVELDDVTAASALRSIQSLADFVIQRTAEEGPAGEAQPP